MHLILVNGEDALDYEFRIVADLIDQRTQFKAYPINGTTSEMTIQCLRIMLDQGVDLFFKIDSDDMYCSNYIETFLDQIGEQKLAQTEQPFAANLIDQLFLTVEEEASVRVNPASFEHGLGLSDHEIQIGMKVGAPPTYVFNRKAAQLIVEHGESPEYQHLVSDDAMMRHLLFDHGVIIDQISTQTPVFGYVLHGSNISNPG